MQRKKRYKMNNEDTGLVVALCMKLKQDTTEQYRDYIEQSKDQKYTKRYQVKLKSRKKP